MYLDSTKSTITLDLNSTKIINKSFVLLDAFVEKDSINKMTIEKKDSVIYLLESNIKNYKLLDSLNTNEINNLQKDFNNILYENEKNKQKMKSYRKSFFMSVALAILPPLILILKK